MTTAAPLPDARPDNWVDRYAPRPIRPWLKLARFDRPIGTWLLMLPGWQAVALAGAQDGKWPDVRLLILIAIGALVMRGAPQLKVRPSHACGHQVIRFMKG